MQRREPPQIRCDARLAGIQHEQVGGLVPIQRIVGGFQKMRADKAFDFR